MTLSVIVPIFNEANFVDRLLEAVMDDETGSKEILLVDGGSTDGTLEKLAEWQNKFASIKIITNPSRFVSHGFNKAFEEATGRFIAFIGAHAVYPHNYFSIAIKYMESGECDVVGGPLRQVGKTTVGNAIAKCMSSKFGVGGTEFRISTKRQYVQSVAFAVYKREVFEKAGLLDEELIRNQDDELHYRLNKSGFRILMVPEMSCTYFVRDSIGKLMKQYFQYGLFKPLVFKKVKAGFRPRHFVPALFVLYLISLPLTIHFSIYTLPGILYLVMDIAFSFLGAGSLQTIIYSLFIYPALHISYGAGFLLGLRKLI